MRQRISLAECNEPTAQVLRCHPLVDEVQLCERTGLSFTIDGRRREIVVGPVGEDPFGLVELEDNNPLVCAGRVGVPSPGGTLALIALGPIVEAGLLLEAPTMITNAPDSEADVARDLRSIGWHGGLTLSHEQRDFAGALAASVIAAILTPRELSDIDDLFGERLGRSYFVIRDESSEWDVRLVHHQPHAVYRLRITPGDPHSLLTVQVMADANGKCGAAQLVHAMNVMCGYEETIGLA